MRLTRRKLRKLLLRETHLLQEGSTKQLLIEIGEALAEIVDSAGGKMLWTEAIKTVYNQRPDLQQYFPKKDMDGFPVDFGLFIYNHMGWGVPDVELYIGTTGF